jgi:hypothetical protein
MVDRRNELALPMMEDLVDEVNDAAAHLHNHIISMPLLDCVDREGHHCKSDAGISTPYESILLRDG